MKYMHEPPYPSRRSPVLARNMVATSHPLATQAGLRMLMSGGNAVDAAIAAAITLVVVEPTGNGIGSDAFCILWDGKELHGLNASGRSPALWSLDRFRPSGVPHRGWDTVTVPGAVSAWADLSRRFGRLEFARLFEPAIGYAERGFQVTPVIAEQWRRAALELYAQPGFAECFMPDGRAPGAGETFRSPAMAQSLRLIGDTGGEAFYRGELARKIADHARACGAVLTEADLAAHRNDWCGTLAVELGACQLHEIPPNGQGIAALMALGMLRELAIEDLGPDTVESHHLQIEAMKLAFADLHRYVADSRAMVSVTSAALLERSYLAKRAKLVDRTRAQHFRHGSPKAGGTVCLSAADAEGMMVSYIQSNFEGFGSGVVVPGTGISLQNRGRGFVLEEGHPNVVGPAKRPFHTIIPGFVTDGGGQPLMAFGLMGGSMQAQGHVQMVLRTQIHRQDPQTAADAPRWRVVNDMQVSLEASIDPAIAEGLVALGHEVTMEDYHQSFAFGGAQMISRVAGGYAAGSDPRKDGLAAGF